MGDHRAGRTRARTLASAASGRADERFEHAASRGLLPVAWAYTTGDEAPLAIDQVHRGRPEDAPGAGTHVARPVEQHAVGVAALGHDALHELGVLLHVDEQDLETA